MSARARDPLSDAIGAHMRLAREIRGYSQTELARRLGMSKQQTNAWENGRSEIVGAKLIAMARLLGFSPAWLLVGRDMINRRADQ